MEEWRKVAQATMDDLAKSGGGGGCLLVFIIPITITLYFIL